MTSVPDAVEALSAQLREALGAAGDEIDAEEEALLEAWPVLSVVARRRALRRLTTRVVELAASAAETARGQVARVVSEAYRLGAGQSAAAAGAAVVLSGADTTTIAAMAGDTYADVLAATRHVQESTKDLVRALARERLGDKLEAGQTPAQAAARLRRDLEGRGISAVVYKDGSRHGLRDYTDMLVRTKSAEAAQLGGFAQAREQGIEFMEILDGPGCGWTSHQDPRKANGLILPLDEAARFPLSHPRCRRTSSPRPDLTADTVAGAAPLGPQFSAEDIARAAADPGVETAASPAAARARARVERRNGDGTLVTERGLSKAQRANAARVRKRTRPTGRT